MFLSLLLAIWLFLVLAGLVVFDCGLSLLQAYVSELQETSSLQEEFEYGQLWHRISSGVQMEPGRILGSVVLMDFCGFSWVWQLSRSYDVRLDSTPGRLVLS